MCVCRLTKAREKKPIPPRGPNIQDPQSKYPGPQFQGPPRKLTAPSDPPTGHFHPCRLLGRVRHPLGHFQIWNLRPPMDQDPSRARHPPGHFPIWKPPTTHGPGSVRAGAQISRTLDQEPFNRQLGWQHPRWKAKSSPEYSGTPPHFSCLPP